MDERTNETGQETVTSEELMEEIAQANSDGAGGQNARGMPGVGDGETSAGRVDDGGPGDGGPGDSGPGVDGMDDQRDELTRGLAALMEDGWTQEELTAFSRDEGVARDIAEGKSLESAALRYLRRAAGTGRAEAAQQARMAAGNTTDRVTAGRATAGRAGVPTVRAASAGETDAGDPIARMSDREFDAFYARAMEKAMTGARVRI